MSDRDGANDLDPARYRQLVERGPEITAVLDRENAIRYVNQTVNDLLEREPAALAGTDIGAVVHPADRDRLQETLAAARNETGRAGPTDLRVEHADGSWSWLAAIAQYRSDEDALDGVVVSMRPTDAPREQREAMSERMELALAGANIGIWDWDMGTDRVERDELLTEMLGYTPEEWGDHIDDWEALVHPEGKRRHDEALAEHVENRTPFYDCEYRLRTAAGDWKWVRTIGKVVEWDGEGEPTRAVGIHQDVDDRKRAELALEEERDLFRAGPAMVFTWRDEPGWPIESVSANVADILGYAPAELEAGATPLAELVHEDDLERLEAEVAEQAGNKRVNPTPYRIRTTDGDAVWVMEYTQRLHESEGTNRLRGYLVDITDRKRREEKYRNLFEGARDAIMVFDRDGYLDCNERTLELFGFESSEEFLQQTPWKLSPPTQPDGRDSKRAALEHVDRAFEEGEAFFEWTHQRPDGTTFPCEVKLSRFEYGGEAVLHALIRDISDRKAQQEQLAAERNRIRAITNAIPDVSIVYDRAGEYREVLTGQEHLLVDSPSELVGTTVRDVMAPDVAATILDGIEHSLDTDSVQTVVYSLELGGERTWFEGRIAPIPGGDRDEVVLLARDVTELKQYEAELETQRDNLEVLNTVVRHDIRNELQLVLAYAETLTERVEGEGTAYLDRILEATEDAIDITTTARDVTEILLEADADPRPLNLAPVLEEEVTDLRDSHTDAIVTLDRPLPSADVMADDMLHSVFRNILQNAIAHNDKLVPEVTVAATRDGETVTVEIADNGPGVPADRAEAIFEEGEQGIESEGTGLGLYLVDTLVSRYDGTVRVEDNDPEGAVFVLSFPVAEAGE